MDEAENSKVHWHYIPIGWKFAGLMSDGTPYYEVALRTWIRLLTDLFLLLGAAAFFVISLINIKPDNIWFLGSIFSIITLIAMVKDSFKTIGWIRNPKVISS